MIYHEIRHKAIPSLSFMKDTDYILYVGPELTPLEQSKLHSKDIDVPVIYVLYRNIIWYWSANVRSTIAKIKSANTVSCR